MFLSYAPDTLMKQLELFLLSIEVEIPLLSLGVAEYNGLAMRYVRNTRPLLPRKGESRSICSRVPSKTAQVETQEGPGRPKDQRLKRKTEGHTNPPNQEGGKQIHSENVAAALLSGFRCSTFTKTSCRRYFLEISDDSESENHLEAEPGELRNDLPLSDPISEFPSSRETSRVGDGRAANGSPAEGKRVPTVPRERSRSPLSSRGEPPRQAPFSQCADNEKKESTLAAQEDMVYWG